MLLLVFFVIKNNSMQVLLLLHHIYNMDLVGPFHRECVTKFPTLIFIKGAHLGLGLINALKRCRMWLQNRQIFDFSSLKAVPQCDPRPSEDEMHCIKFTNISPPSPRIRSYSVVLPLGIMHRSMHVPWHACT